LFAVSEGVHRGLTVLVNEDEAAASTAGRGGQSLGVVMVEEFKNLPRADVFL
jgi:hypothetical protein